MRRLRHSCIAPSAKLSSMQKIASGRPRSSTHLRNRSEPSWIELARDDLGDRDLAFEPGLRHRLAIAGEPRQRAVVEIAGEIGDRAAARRRRDGCVATAAASCCERPMLSPIGSSDSSNVSITGIPDRVRMRRVERRVADAGDDDRFGALSEQRLDRLFLLVFRVAAVDDDDMEPLADQLFVQREQIVGEDDVVESGDDDPDQLASATKPGGSPQDWERSRAS